MASPGPKAIGYLELNIDGFDKAIKSAKNLLGGLAAGFATFKVGEFFKDGIKDAIEFGKEMQNASRTMAGFDPGALLLVQKALEKTGMGAQEAQGHIDDFIKSGRDISEIFMGADNYAAALKDASKDYGRQADILTRSGKALQTVWNTIEAISGKVRTFFLAMTEQFVKPLQVALDYINQIDLGSIGAEFGKYIADAANILIGLFKNGDIYTALQLGLTLAFKESVNWLVGGLKYASDYAQGSMMEALSTAFDESVKFLGSIMDKFFNTDVIVQLGNAIIAAWAYSQAKVYEILSEFIEYIRAGIIYGVISSFKTSLNLIKTVFSSEFWESMWDGFKDINIRIAAGLIDAITKALEYLKQGLPIAIQAAVEGMKNLFGAGSSMVGEIANEKSFSDIKNSSLVRADTTRGIAGLFEGIGDSSSKKAAPLIEKLKDAFTSSYQKAQISFQKGSVFDTDDERAKFADIIGRATATAQTMGGKAGNGNKAPNVLTNFSTNAGSRYVIADNLAKVGGGGGYLNVGMSLAQRDYMERQRARKANEETAKATQQTAINTAVKPGPAIMGN